MRLCVLHIGGVDVLIKNPLLYVPMSPVCLYIRISHDFASLCRCRSSSNVGGGWGRWVMEGYGKDPREKRLWPKSGLHHNTLTAKHVQTRCAYLYDLPFEFVPKTIIVYIRTSGQRRGGGLYTVWCMCVGTDFWCDKHCTLILIGTCILCPRNECAVGNIYLKCMI